MRLVKSGRIIEDRFVRWLDDGPAPERTAVIVPHERLLADPGLGAALGARAVERARLFEPRAAALRVKACYEQLLTRQ